MAKRRTRKNKVFAHHQFTLKWEPSSKKSELASSVKGQLKKQVFPSSLQTQKVKSANLLAQEGSVKAVKSDIIKSLILASFILSLEVVVYLIWSVR
ncbi:MAG: hypothetical protein ABIJ85_01830 [bacterium]